ncbi:DUF4438 domain-containing protein, partial [Corallococcus terminator]
MDVPLPFVMEPATRASTSPRTNESRLVESAVAGQVSHPIVHTSPYRVGRD